MTPEQIAKIAAEAGAKAAIEAIREFGGSSLQETISDITKEAAKAGAEAVKRENKLIAAQEHARTKDRRLRNTRLLLKNYRSLKSHCEQAVSELSELDADDMQPGMIFEIMSRGYSSEEVYIDAIRRTAGRTAIMIGHLERMLHLYETACAASAFESERRRWRILKDRYLMEKPLPLSEIADREHIHKRTAERDLDAAIESLSALIFGIDGIR